MADRRVKKRVRFLSLVGLATLLIAACERPDPRLESMIGLEPAPPSRSRIEELRDLIDEYGEVVGQKVDAGIRQADALKLLAQEYMRQQLYGQAFDVLQEAIIAQPENHVLHYLAGASAGVIGKSQSDLALQEEFYGRAERSYRRAIEIEPNYTDALYGLAVLYAFETNEPLNAIEPLERILDRNDAHIPSLFVLARSHAALGSLDEAVAAYDRIIEASPDREERERAERNRTLLLGGTS